MLPVDHWADLEIAFLAELKYLTLTVCMLVCVCVICCDHAINQDETAKIMYDLI